MNGMSLLKHHYLKNLYHLKYGRYYWCRLHVRKKSLSRLWDKKYRSVSRFVSQKWYITFDCFENFFKMCIAIYHLHPANISFSSRISMAVLKTALKTEVKLTLLTDIDKLLIVKKWIEGICHAI